MCKHIVGTEKAVKMKRMLNSTKSISGSTRSHTIIQSGSMGEGLEMNGSDLDMMHVMEQYQVFENTTTVHFDPTYTHCVLLMEDTKAGFTRLRLLYTSLNDIFEVIKEVDGVWYLSSLLFKLYMQKINILNSKYILQVVHGPCLSDINGKLDNAFCLHSKSWILPANQWITRHRGMWPDVDVMSKIIDYGVLFVLVGRKESPNEDVEWRMSFSVGEKLLIYSFTHTQLLCYVLMKILLKDVINRDNRCKDVLCSYFIKTIIFWVSEELPVSMWKPENLIPCFMKCVQRLIYCVKYVMCPHYFIEGKNLFENKIEGERHTNLLENLNTLNSFDWRCIMFSEQMQAFLIRYDVFSYNPISFANNIEPLLKSNAINFIPRFSPNFLQKIIQNITAVESSRVKLVFLFFLSSDSIFRAQNVYISDKDENKTQYKQYKISQCYSLQGLYHDAVSGWLTLASCFYKMKQYSKAIYVLSHALSKSSSEKLLLFGNKLVSVEQRQWYINCWAKMGVLHACMKLSLRYLYFEEKSFLIPKELKMKVDMELILWPALADRKIIMLPTESYAYFLCFLCHYHSKDIRQCYNSLRDFERFITDYLFTKSLYSQALTCKLYGIALEHFKEYEAAQRVFRKAAILLDRFLAIRNERPVN